jgi:ADP-heptose:LPS heptosyltransferase
MGDCLLLTSPVRALKNEFPAFRISVLVDARFAPCFSGNGDFDEVIAVGGKAATLLALVRRRFDLIVNLHGGPTSLLYALAARGPAVGAEHYQYASLYQATYPKPDASIHTAASTLATFRWMGVRALTAPPLRFDRSEMHAAQMSERLTTAAGEAHAYAVIHPAALMDTKRWPLDRFAELAAWLRQQPLRIVVTSGPGEEALARQLQQSIGDATLLTGLTIPELAELIRGARLYIGNDSGPMHLATAVGTPTVAIWGSSSSARWHPWGVEHRVVQNPFSCNPCPGYRCLVASSPLCIESVTVEQVREAVVQVIRPGDRGSGIGDLG